VVHNGQHVVRSSAARQGRDQRSMAAWPAGEGRRGTWREGMTPRRLGARNSLGKARAGEGAEAAGGPRRGTRGRRSGTSRRVIVPSAMC
jgi:hypothetical protein